MTTNKHPMPASPLPWHDAGDGEGAWDSREQVIEGYDYDGMPIEGVAGGQELVFQSGKRDAAYILWACNNAPSLAAEVARLRAALDEAAADAHKVALITDKNARIVGALAVAAHVRAALEAK